MKKIKIVGVFLIFGLSVLSHFIYDWMPNNLFSILFPVNESIWEHMKLIATPVLIFGIFEYFIYKKKDIFFNNFLLSYAVSIILGIIVYLIIYFPIDYLFGHNTFVAIILLFITFILVQVFSYYILNYKKIKYSGITGLLLLLLLYIVFGYLTYNPPHIELFLDPQENIYGIQKK